MRWIFLKEPYENSRRRSSSRYLRVLVCCKCGSAQIDSVQNRVKSLWSNSVYLHQETTHCYLSHLKVWYSLPERLLLPHYCKLLAGCDTPCETSNPCRWAWLRATKQGVHIMMCWWLCVVNLHHMHTAMCMYIWYSISFVSISFANWDPHGRFSTGMSTPTRLRETKGRVEEIEREDQDIKERSACVDQSIQNVLCFSSHWLAWPNGIVFGVTLYLGSFFITRAASRFLLPSMLRDLSAFLTSWFFFSLADFVRVCLFLFSRLSYCSLCAFPCLVRALFSLAPLSPSQIF